MGLNSLHLLAIVLSAARKTTEQQSSSKEVNCSLCLCLQAKTAQSMKNSSQIGKLILKRVLVDAKLVLFWHVQLTPTNLLL